jgi:Cell wall binding domain 2 (CWB2)
MVSAPMRRPPIPMLCLVAALAGCGGKTATRTDQPKLGAKGTDTQAAQGLGFPEIATKNTTRVGGADAVADAAGVAQAVFPATDAASRPKAVTLVDSGDWRAGIAAAALVAPPVGAPILFSDGSALPAASSSALEALAPTGSKAAGGAQLIRVGDVAQSGGLKTTDVRGANPFALARAIDAFTTAAAGRAAGHVVVASADRAAFAMPAAAYAAKSGDPVLFATRDALPPDTRAALRTHRHPGIYVLGPPSVIGAKVEAALRKLGKVTRVQGPDPVQNAIAFARFRDGAFGWGVVDPGHGLVFAGAGADPQTAVAAAPLSASGTYGPLLLVGDPAGVDAPLGAYLLDIQPGYAKDPVRGVYNHGWIVGDERAVSIAAQSQIDRLLEISPVNQRNASR